MPVIHDHAVPAARLRTARTASSRSGAHPVLALQRAAGNTAVAASPQKALPQKALPPALQDSAPSGPASFDVSDAVELSAELTRASALVAGPLAPLGVLVGAGVDALQSRKDLQALRQAGRVVPQERHPAMALGVTVRSGIAMASNAAGTVGGALETARRAAQSVGVDLPGMDANIQLVTGVRLPLDGALGALDVLLAAGARDIALGLPRGPGQSAWRDVAAGFSTRAVNDVVGVMGDATDLATAGAAGTAQLREVARLVQRLDAAAPGITAWLQAQVVSGTHVPGPRSPAERVALHEAQRELHLVRVLHDAGSDFFADALRRTEAVALLADAGTASGLEGKTTSQRLREDIVAGAGELEGTAHGARELIDLAGRMLDRSTFVATAAGTARSLVERIPVPEFHVPVPPGNDTLDKVAQAAARMADRVVQQALRPPQSIVRGFKHTAAGAIDLVQHGADEVAQYAGLVREEASTALAAAERQTAVLREGVEQADSVEQVLDVGLRQVSELAGLRKGLSVQAVRDSWSELGLLLDQAEQAVAAAARDAEEPSGADELVPADPPDDDAL